MVKNILLSNIAKAIFTVNRHAKTAPEPQHLYHIKKEAINQLLTEGRAEELGLHFSDHPKFSNQHSTVLVSVDYYYFHIIHEIEVFEKIKYLDYIDQTYLYYRNYIS